MSDKFQPKTTAEALLYQIAQNPAIGEARTAFLPEAEIVFSGGSWRTEGAYAFVEGKTYSVKWDGAEYNCVAYVSPYAAAGVVSIGNKVDIGENTGEPFVMSSIGGTSLQIVRKDGKYTGSVTVSVDEVTVHKVDEKYLPDGIAKADTAEVGQTIVVKSVDENGKPTEWEAADLPTNYRLIKRIMLEEETATIDAFTTDEDGNEFNLRDIVVVSSNLTRGESSTDTSGGHIRVWVSTKNFYNAFANSSIFTSNAYICPDYLSNISNGIYAAVHLFGTVACCEENKADGTMRKRFYVAAKGDFIQRIAFSTNNANRVTMAPGTIIEVWGVDA